MDDNRVTKQALKWSPTDGKRKRGQPRKNWKTTVIEDLKKLNMDWDEAEQKHVEQLCCPVSCRHMEELRYKGKDATESVYREVTEYIKHH